MEVKILSWTHSPVDLISECAGVCYGKDDVSFKRVENCFKRGHMGVFEHAVVTFKVSGISRACSHQLVRHRMASYNQESQRYCKMAEDYPAVKPKSVEDAGALSALWDAHVKAAVAFYRKMLEAGVPAEDARYILPQGGTTTVKVTMNVRELYHFLDLRTNKTAQWEIRALAQEMAKQARAIDDQWAQLVELWEAGSC